LSSIPPKLSNKDFGSCTTASKLVDKYDKILAKL